MVAGFLVAAYYAWRLLHGPDSAYDRRALGLALVLGAIMTPVQLVVGDQIARRVAAIQPVKLAAMEGQFQSQANAPLHIGGIPDEAEGRTNLAIEIPGLLSLLAYGDRQAVVAGLESFPREDWPPVVVVHIAFQIMVAGGGMLALVSLLAAVVVARRRRVSDSRWLLWLIVAAGPVSLVALEAGWVVTEVGRQPWIVHQVARTADMVTRAPYVGWTLLAAACIYLAIALGTWRILRLLAAIPLTENPGAT
jgi:cytochrome d ubiquinol oxidase subunit I